MVVDIASGSSVQAAGAGEPFYILDRSSSVADGAMGWLTQASTQHPGGPMDACTDLLRHNREFVDIRMLNPVEFLDRTEYMAR